MSIEVFFSYSHRDEDMRDGLEKHLALLIRANIITSWHDRRIPAGNELVDEIDHHLTTAHVILLLISADFLASDYCYGIEMTKAMERHAQGTARVIPIILHACDWSDAPFSRLQSLPKDAKPISSWRNRHEAFAAVARGIRNAIEGLTVAQPLPPTLSGMEVVELGLQSNKPVESASKAIAENYPPVAPPPSASGVCHALDCVSIAYSNELRRYHVVFKKVIRNMSARPRDHTYARIDVCIIPDDPELGQAYYHDHPLSLDGINFRALDGDGHNLDVRILHQYPSNIEMHLRFRDPSTGEFFPVYENQEIEVIYTCDVSDRQWGTYLKRHVRVKTDRLEVQLTFPKNLVRVWGNEEVGDGVAALAQGLERRIVGDDEVYTWSTSAPDQESIFLFRWKFLDGRDKALYEELRQRYGKPQA